MNTRIAFVLFLTALYTPSAFSYERVSIQIIIEDLRDNSCGLTEQSLLRRTKLTLRQYNIHETDYSNPYLYVNANVMESEQICFASIEISIRGFSLEDFEDGGMGWVTKAPSRYTVLQEDGAIFSAPPHEFTSFALNNLERNLKEALGGVEF